MSNREYHIVTDTVIETLHNMIENISKNKKRGLITAAEAAKEIEKTVNRYMSILNDLIYVYGKEAAKNDY